MKRKSMRQRKKERQEKASSTGGLISQFMAITPLMQKRLLESRTIFSNESVLQKFDTAQLEKQNQANYLQVKELTFIKDGKEETESRKIDMEFVWNKILKDKKKSKLDYKLIAEEISKEYLEADEKYVNVDYTTYNKNN